MTVPELLRLLQTRPLVASVQASEGSAVDSPEMLAALARASRDQGVRLLRVQGVENLKVIRAATGLPTVGLIKRTYADSEVYITPTLREVDEILDTGVEIVAFDATARLRPNGEMIEGLIRRIHERGALALADVDSVSNAEAAVAAGADLVSSTLAGYTSEHPITEGPDLEVLRQIVQRLPVPVFAEGRYALRWEVEAALRIGAAGVIVGGALNDPVKQTRALTPSTVPTGDVGAVDIGGTWLRFGVFTPDWKLISSERTPNPPLRGERIEWIRERVASSGVVRLGVSTGGIIDPSIGTCWTAKEYLMPDHIGLEFSEAVFGVPTFAHGDGHATAWGHANLPRYAGRRVATLALGTGVGAGFVRDGKIWAGRRGEYPRVNDLPARGGATYEQLLGGLHLTREPSEEQKTLGIVALEGAIQVLKDLYFPDDLIVGGSVGLSPWLEPHLSRLGAEPSPFGPDAGLYGAAALALFPTYR